MTGTFVSVGNLRIAALAAASPLLMDAVVCGHDRDYVALLAWPNVAAAKELAEAPDAAPEELVRSPKLAAFLRERFIAYNRSNPASSTRIERVIAAGRAAVAGRQRDHRQGLRQPARGARAARGARRRAVRRGAGSRR